MATLETGNEPNPELGSVSDFRELVLSELRAFEERTSERLDRLEDRVSRISEPRRSNEDMTERVMMWFGIAYLVSLLLPPLLQLIRGNDAND